MFSYLRARRDSNWRYSYCRQWVCSTIWRTLKQAKTNSKEKLLRTYILHNFLQNSSSKRTELRKVEMDFLHLTGAELRWDWLTESLVKCRESDHSHNHRSFVFFIRVIQSHTCPVRTFSLSPPTLNFSLSKRYLWLSTLPSLPLSLFLSLVFYLFKTDSSTQFHSLSITHTPKYIIMCTHFLFESYSYSLSLYSEVSFYTNTFSPFVTVIKNLLTKMLAIEMCCFKIYNIFCILCCCMRLIFR